MSRVDISQLSDFEQAALRKAAQIPPGQVRSYGWIAREIGHPQAARAVGQAMARNPVALFFPCHRVVDASGALHNYGYGVEMKARLLQMEGYVK
jgi:methylated-DNA-[protein]-cysteine S-methyltransferase